MVSRVSKLFGSKADKDIKGVTPYVAKINAEFDKLANLSNDQLRAKTTEFKSRVNDYLSEIDIQITDLRAEIEEATLSEIDKKEAAYDKIDDLEKQRDEELEEILKELLPEAFAVVKETARRFTLEDSLSATATQMDRDLAAAKEHISILGNDVVYQTTWDAAGQEVTWNMIHYDVQLIGGVVLHEGKVAEMQTGEGKTLVSTLPAYLNALGQRGVHIVTVNDYLARRDAEWNAPIFQFHGLSVDCLDYYRPHSPERKAAYLADITYGTNNEFGFDYLRDNMAHSPDEQVQQKHHFAMIDEVDSVLIDDARTPLIISGPTPKGDIHEFNELKPKIQKVVDAQKRYLNTALTDAKKLLKEGKTNEKEAGLLLFRCQRGFPKSKPLIKFLGEQGMKALMTKAENFYLQDQQKEMHVVDSELYFTIDEKNNQIELTDKGIDLITDSSDDKNFFVMPDVGSEIAELEKSTLSEDEKVKKKDELYRNHSVKSERIHSINQLLKAYAMFEKDVEYIIQDSKVKIVDEQTGRVMDGRRYSDGLHQAIEAKENVKVEAATQTFATITLQNFFRMYHKLSGMTGTAETEEGELWEIYKLDVVVIPTNRPIARDDRDDLVYKTVREKFNAVADEIIRLQKEGRPVLVGTTSVDVSELLSRMLNMKKITHSVLNAKQHQREADIVAAAGQAGSITLATNMAGRGTDIKLGKGVKEAGGLAIIGTERHDSRRVDRQLRGRAGRQGDPGSSQFFVSLEDNLMRLFGSDRVSKVMDKFGYEEGEVIQHSMISKTIERSQKKVEQNNFGIRKRLLEYDDVMNKQRVVIYSRRRNALFGDRLSVDVNNAIYDWIEETVTSYKDAGDYDGFKEATLRHLAFEPDMNVSDFSDKKIDVVVQTVFEQAMSAYERKTKDIRERAIQVFRTIHADRGSDVKNILVPFSDGKKSINVSVNLEKALATDGAEITDAFERFVALASIDDHWKEHLRELDDLKQTANNASYEQKDPLLIYKLESFNLFQMMISTLNSEIVSLLFKGNIPIETSDDMKEAKERKRADMSKMRTSRAAEALVSQENGQQKQAEEPKAVAVPMRSEPKVGRNDDCPCGSGKKYKKCHGKAS
ncbi:preprotein translocase subunit SecA [Bacteroidia bacterium]|nr:preprotein translocase subunit SecA [Bacteroidia bacterium]